MRSAECGMAMKGRSLPEAFPAIPHSAFRTPHWLAGALLPALPPPPAGAQQPDSIPTDTLAPVVVTGVRLPTVRELARGLAGRTASLDAQDLDARGVRSLADALEQLPGVTTSDELGATAQMDVSLRGFQVSPVIGVPQGVTVYVDGVRANEPDGARNRGVGGKLGPLRAESARGRPAWGVGLLRGRALRARGRLARGHPQPHWHAVREARIAEWQLGRHAQLLGRGQPDFPGW